MANSPAAFGSKLSSIQNLLFRQITSSSPITTTAVSANSLLVHRYAQPVNNSNNQATEFTKSDLQLFGRYCWPATLNSTMEARLADFTQSVLEARGRKVAPDDDEFEKDEYGDDEMPIDDEDEDWDDEDADEDEYCSDDTDDDKEAQQWLMESRNF